jgi:hypothetical protein
MRTTAKMGLTSWDQPTDPYNYAQLAQNWQILDYHDHTPGKGSPIAAGGLAPGAVLSNSLAANIVGVQHLSTALAQDLGLNVPGSVGQGYVNIPTSQNTSSASYTTLTTPDQISNVVVGAGGIIYIGYLASWSSSVGAAANAAIFVGNNQIQSVPTTTSTAPAVQAASGTSAGITSVLGTSPTGLQSGTQSSNFTGNVITGQLFEVNANWGFAAVFQAAGTYTISIRFKVSSGTVTASNRQLWVWTRNFT